jgi:uncharacterized protein YacL
MTFAARSLPSRAERVPRTILRVVFMVLFAVTGFLLGREAYVHLISLHVANQGWLIALTIGAPVAGALGGLFLAPVAVSVFEVELDAVEGALERLSAGQISGGAIGLIAGLVIAFLLKSVLFEANAGYVLLGIFAAFLGVRVGAKRLGPGAARGVPTTAAGIEKIIDTSVIVDGRVLEILEAGFLEGPLLLPRFVLRELQTIADSTDPKKRTRGRRGLEVLAKMQELGCFEIVERDYDDAVGVDAKLVRLARERNGKLVTNDYNLNRVAHVEGVAVLNINELAGAVKPVVLPGEDLHVTIVRDGKEAHQGVGYLDDGTMIVVENGRRLLGEATDVQVTSVLQTAAGRMIFAKLKRAPSVTS